MVAVYSVYNLVATALKSVVSAFVTGIDSIFGDMAAKNEKESLQNSFNLYEFVYCTISTILYISAIILIISFISIYTKDFTDANYYQPLFAFILILTTMINSLRSVYSSLIYSLGHFKQTNLFSWGEAVINIGVSLLLVSKYGLVGVAIGSFAGTFIKLVYFMIYSSKNILNKSSFSSLKWLFIMALEIVICYGIYRYTKLYYIPINYIQWIIYAIIISIINTIIIIILNILFNLKTSGYILKFVKTRLKFSPKN